MCIWDTQSDGKWPYSVRGKGVLECVHASSDGFLPENSPAHLLEVVEVESQPLVALLGQVGQLPAGAQQYISPWRWVHVLRHYLNLVQLYLFAFESKTIPKKVMTRAKSCSSLFDHLSTMTTSIYVSHNSRRYSLENSLLGQFSFLLLLLPAYFSLFLPLDPLLCQQYTTSNHFLFTAVNMFTYPIPKLPCLAPLQDKFNHMTAESA